jgi:short-subunit dehydrogenase
VVLCMATALIIGASSGIGRCLAVQLSARGYELGLVARRGSLLSELAAQLPGRVLLEALDVADMEATTSRLPVLIGALGRLDLFVYCAGVGHLNPELLIEPELEATAVNVLGFMNTTILVSKVFERQAHGHIVGLSSVACIRGGRAAPAYGASKAFMTHYLEALDLRYAGAGRTIFVTDIQLGFVATQMAKSPVKFWVASPETAAAGILRAVELRQRKQYVTRRWRLYAWLMRMLPFGWLARLN